MKVTVVGGGGFRTPYVWDALRDLPIQELVLHDVDGERLSRIESVITALGDGAGPAVTTTTDLDRALDGAGFVFCAIRVGGLDGRVIDETVPLATGVLGQETVGPGGICFALRTIPVVDRIAAAVAKRAPDAWFVNFTNPAGVITEVVRKRLGPRAVGICDSPAALCTRVAHALGRKTTELTFDYLGLNHLGWLLGVSDGRSDLLPRLIDGESSADVLEARLVGIDRVRALGCIPNEYLVYYEHPGEIVGRFRDAGESRGELLRRQQTAFYADKGDALPAWRAARDARFGSYMAEAGDDHIDDAPDDEGPGDAGYSAIAASFVRAATGATEEQIVLNVPNEGRIAELDDDAVIETTCTVSSGIVRAVGGRALPAEAADLVERVKYVERTTIEAAETGSRELALEAIAAHPVVPDRETAEQILGRYLDAFPDLALR